MGHRSPRLAKQPPCFDFNATRSGIARPLQARDGYREHTHAEERGHVLDFISRRLHPAALTWQVAFHDEFAPDFAICPGGCRIRSIRSADCWNGLGRPQLGRPQVDTLNGSRHANMKEIRFRAADGEWRIAFAFDPTREAVLLVAGDKSGGNERRFYRARSQGRRAVRPASCPACR